MVKGAKVSGGGEKVCASVVNEGFFSDYFLGYRLDAGLADLYGRWDVAEREVGSTPRTRLRSLSVAFDKFRAEASLTAPGDDVLDGRLDVGVLSADSVAAQRQLNEAVLEALGWVPTRNGDVELISGDRSVRVVAAHRADTHSGLLLVAVDAVFSADPAGVVAPKGGSGGSLLDPVVVGGKPAAFTVLEAAQVVFTSDDPPAYLLVVAGGCVVLLDRERWVEGVYIAANLDDALARHDTRPKGELAAIAALFSADAVNPGSDAQSVLGSLLDRSVNESAGVSKDLRLGVRRSVELLARAVVADMRHRQHAAWMDTDTKELTRQCLRYLYRVIVLLFAEAKPELGILPVDDPDYQTGYSIGRLREVALTELLSDQANSSTHLQKSLSLLFRLVNEGYQPGDTLGDDARGLQFRALRSSLFSDTACPLIDRAVITDEVLKRVIEHLCFTPERAGQQRQALSYSTLGINQLGAVYEGLMAYSGFLATEDLFEIDQDGNPDTGTWVIPVRRADEFPTDVFMVETGPDGQERRVRYQKGDFVFRLSGRDRQRSASYYTPQVLTEFTVRHALDVFFDENPELTAADMLQLTICEPALGSGAFLNEAINQLAARYLKTAQDHQGETIDPDLYQHELQKAKAHFAVNQAFGVDLNQTAVELAEVSLWLNCMHQGLEAPWFGARLRRGNSLIGARRATYTPGQVKDTAWTGKQAVAPTDQPLHTIPFGETTGIHHFLLPGEGWGAAADAKELKELDSDWVKAIKSWRQAIHRKPTQQQTNRLTALAARVEQLWQQSTQEVANLSEATRHHIDVWGNPTPPAGSRFGQDTIRTALTDPRSATGRLRTVMDAWCSLWLWAPQHGTNLPTLDNWLTATEAILGKPDPHQIGQLLNENDNNTDPFKTEDPATTETNHPWLTTCKTITQQQAWFHWELEHAPIFQTKGGFHIQIGNPPWIRPTWDDTAALAEHDPWFGITDKIPTALFRRRRGETLQPGLAVSTYQEERSENAGLNHLLDTGTREPLLMGVQTNLYMVFMTNSWRRAKDSGVVALLHPESHFIDPKGGPLRGQTYRRLREHWQFINEAFLFPEIHHSTEFGVNVYGSERHPSFRQAVNLMSPATADRSIEHDGTGPTPGIQHIEGGWDQRPHRARIVTVNDEVLGDWVKLFDRPGTSADQSRLLRPLTDSDLEALAVFARQPGRLSDQTRWWSRGFDEDKLKREGTGEWRTEVPDSLEDTILQGPHILNGNPFGQQPRPICRNNTDWDRLALEDLSDEFIPRTNYQRSVPSAEFTRRKTMWGNEAYTDRYREAHREFVSTGLMRTLQTCLLPPGPAHIYTINSISRGTNRQTALWTGLLTSLPLDYLVRISGVGHLTQTVVDALPIPGKHEGLEEALLLRTLRLNCVLRRYDSLWKELFDPSWPRDSFLAASDTPIALGAITAVWTETTPLRRDYERWLALCEIDAVASLLLGLTRIQLVQIYRSQFAVLRKYEHRMVFDANGRQVAKDHQAYGFHQARWEQSDESVSRRQGMWERVGRHLQGDTAVDLGPFSPPFRSADREAAMSRAYWGFVDRYDLRPPDLSDRDAT